MLYGEGGFSFMSKSLPDIIRMATNQSDFNSLILYIISVCASRSLTGFEKIALISMRRLSLLMLNSLSPSWPSVLKMRRSFWPGSILSSTVQQQYALMNPWSMFSFLCLLIIIQNAQRFILQYSVRLLDSCNNLCLDFHATCSPALSVHFLNALKMSCTCVLQKWSNLADFHGNRRNMTSLDCKIARE